MCIFKMANKNQFLRIQRPVQCRAVIVEPKQRFSGLVIWWPPNLMFLNIMKYVTQSLFCCCKIGMWSANINMKYFAFDLCRPSYPYHKKSAIKTNYGFKFCPISSNNYDRWQHVLKLYFVLVRGLAADHVAARMSHDQTIEVTALHFECVFCYMI